VGFDAQGFDRAVGIPNARIEHLSLPRSRMHGINHPSLVAWKTQAFACPRSISRHDPNRIWTNEAWADSWHMEDEELCEIAEHLAQKIPPVQPYVTGAFEIEFAIVMHGEDRHIARGFYISNRFIAALHTLKANFQIDVV
jgi:hypothetical protein